MKTQILSRIQSYQNISSTNASSLKKISFLPNNYQHELKEKNRNGNIQEDDPYQSAKFLIPSIKVSTNKLFQSSTTLDPFKRVNNNSNQKETKKQANSKYKSLQKNRENRLYKIEKKMSGDYKKETKSQNSINDLPHLLNKGTKIHSSANKTQTYKTISNPRLHGTKTVAGSENQIKAINENQTPEKNEIKNKPINFLMKTVNVFKDYKQSPYFAFSNKKSESFKPDKTRPVRSLYRISTQALNQKQEDVSIQISVENLETEDKPKIENENQNNIEFGCSEIQQKSMENDSSFLDSTQKEFIKQISMVSQKEEKKRVWKKLPNDFLKF